MLTLAIDWKICGPMWSMCLDPKSSGITKWPGVGHQEGTNDQEAPEKPQCKESTALSQKQWVLSSQIAQLASEQSKKCNSGSPKARKARLWNLWNINNTNEKTSRSATPFCAGFFLRSKNSSSGWQDVGIRICNNSVSAAKPVAVSNAMAVERSMPSITMGSKPYCC